MDLLTVIDTHLLVWYFVGSKRLSSAVKDRIDEVRRRGRVIVPTIVLAEALYLAEKERDVSGGSEDEILLDFDALYESLVEDPGFRIVGFDRAVLEETIAACEVPELHDRITAATSRIHDAESLREDPEVEAG